MCGVTCSEAVEDIGELETCEATQLHAKALLAKSDGCLGSVSNWKPSHIRTIGVVIGSSTSTSVNVALFLPVSNECIKTPQAPQRQDVPL